MIFQERLYFSAVADLFLYRPAGGKDRQRYKISMQSP